MMTPKDAVDFIYGKHNFTYDHSDWHAIDRVQFASFVALIEALGNIKDKAFYAQEILAECKSRYNNSEYKNSAKFYCSTRANCMMANWRQYFVDMVEADVDTDSRQFMETIYNRNMRSDTNDVSSELRLVRKELANHSLDLQMSKYLVPVERRKAQQEQMRKEQEEEGYQFSIFELMG